VFGYWSFNNNYILWISLYLLCSFIYRINNWHNLYIIISDTMACQFLQIVLVRGCLSVWSFNNNDILCISLYLLCSFIHRVNNWHNLYTIISDTMACQFLQIMFVRECLWVGVWQVIFDQDVIGFRAIRYRLGPRST